MKVDVHTADEIALGLTRAMLIYEDEENAYVTVHPARLRNGRADVGPGTPADRAALAGLAQKLVRATALSGFLPPQLLYMSPAVVAWSRAAGAERVYFKGDGRNSVGTRNGVAPQPHLVFAVTADAWFVWAVGDASRPTPDSALFRAPHFNVWKQGQICTGNVKLPETISPEVLTEYERAFFGSNFTHPNDPEGLTRHPRGPYVMWRELLDRPAAEFPQTWLAPLKHLPRGGAEKAKAPITLAAAIKHLEDAGAR